jgi:hypothetical protein
MLSSSLNGNSLLAIKQHLWKDLGAPWPELDLTDSHPGQENWSINDLPDILYQLRTNTLKSRGQPMLTKDPIFGKLVRDFPMLPRKISARVEGWRMEAWFRIDRRLTNDDVLDRIDPRWRPTEEELERRRADFRTTFHVAGWSSGSSVAAVMREARRHGIDLDHNTTRGITPGLRDPEQGELGGRVPLPSNWLYFAHPVEWLSNPNGRMVSPTSVMTIRGRKPSTKVANTSPQGHERTVMLSSFQVSSLKRKAPANEENEPPKRSRQAVVAPENTSAPMISAGAWDGYWSQLPKIPQERT